MNYVISCFNGFYTHNFKVKLNMVALKKDIKHLLIIKWYTTFETL